MMKRERSGPHISRERVNVIYDLDDGSLYLPSDLARILVDPQDDLKAYNNARKNFSRLANCLHSDGEIDGYNAYLGATWKLSLDYADVIKAGRDPEPLRQLAKKHVIGHGNQDDRSSGDVAFASCKNHGESNNEPRLSEVLAAQTSKLAQDDLSQIPDHDTDSGESKKTNPCLEQEDKSQTGPTEVLELDFQVASDGASDRDMVKIMALSDFRAKRNWITGVYKLSDRQDSKREGLPFVRYVVFVLKWFSITALCVLAALIFWSWVLVGDDNPSSASLEDLAENRYDRAWEAFQKGEYGEAENLLKLLLSEPKARPLFGDSLHLLGRIMVETGQPEKGMSLFKKSLGYLKLVNKERALCLNHLGEAQAWLGLQNIGNASGALDEAGNCLTGDTSENQLDYYYEVSFLFYLQKGEFDRALASASKRVSLANTNSLMARCDLALAFLLNGDAEEGKRMSMEVEVDCIRLRHKKMYHYNQVNQVLFERLHGLSGPDLEIEAVKKWASMHGDVRLLNRLEIALSLNEERN